MTASTAEQRHTKFAPFRFRRAAKATLCSLRLPLRNTNALLVCVSVDENNEKAIKMLLRPKSLENQGFSAAGYWITRTQLCRCRWQKKASLCFRRRIVWLSDNENQTILRQGEQGVLTPSRTPATLASAHEAYFPDRFRAYLRNAHKSVFSFRICFRP